MSDESRKWRMPLPAPHRRARSEEVLGLSGHQQRASEDEDGEPLSSPSSTPVPASPSSTPPKKTWERHYRSFLSRRDGSPQENGSSVTERVHSFSHLHPGGGKGMFSLMPGSKRLLMRNSSGTISEHGDVPAPSVPSLSRRGSSGDMTVKGGSFFSQVFQKDAPKSPSQPTRKTKSMDALDSTLRRGHEKSYSPSVLKSSIHDILEDGSLLSLSNADLSTHKSISAPPTPVRLHQRPPISPSQMPQAFSPASTRKPASTEIKKAFTEFHNSSAFAKDSTSAYLGDETSVSGNTYFAMYNQLVTKHKESSDHSELGVVSHLRPTLGLSKSLGIVTEEALINKSLRMLKPIAGPETWNQGRRYLIAPAILATCPLQVVSALSGSVKNLEASGDSSFGIVFLGAAAVTYVGQLRETGSWSKCTFVIRQNYLLEYEKETAGLPRGYAHLQHAVASPHEDFHNALELEFFGSPCAKADKRKMLIRVDNATDRDRWVESFNRASKLVSVSDLFEFNESEVIGSGRYATVYKARRRGTGKGPPNRAIKIVDKNEFWRRVVKGMERADTLVREVSVQATLTSKGGCPSVLQISGLFETSDCLVLESELLEGTDLFKHVSSKNFLTEQEAAGIIRDIIDGLDVMNRYGVAHRDIKPANVLMCDRNKNGVFVKIADFGMSTFVGVDGMLRGRCGTPGYVAPEIFSAGVHGGYSNKVDVFSAGVTLYVMLCGYEPFYGETDAELIAANRHASVDFPESDWGKVSPEARELVVKMLETDPAERISAREALLHPWIVSLTDCGEERSSLQASVPTYQAEVTACTIS